MTDNACQDIRNQVMYYIDNELSEEKRIGLVSHINDCAECQEYICHEQDLKTKICQKLKDNYICRCDVQRLKDSIKDKISGFFQS
jgi:hypothetical protein